ncbi:MAG: cation-transporting P-type ATPase, partial [Firmicutes bacterium]|nr:cation-transporting P-type ATPase [Candidatus Caballimonas caccae]
ITKINGKTEYKGSGTECALLKGIENNKSIKDIESFKKDYSIVSRIPFDNDKKIMSTTIEKSGKEKELIKGAPEKILALCKLSALQKENELKIIEKEQAEARRVLCFCHSENNEYIYDGFVSLVDPIRKEVYSAVEKCRRAGIKIKILTGDNLITAYSIAKELKIVKEKSEVINATDIENLDDESLEKILSRVSVIARSTPIIKMRVVKCLKNCGEVVAVTGDGINDAPAIKQADVGIAMGINGSDITKETADIVLLDDSFSTIVKAISFGRNVYRNLQRFILFQLSVNLSALLFITITAVLGYKTPFNTLQLLWINVIMDGPPALTLGLNSINDKLLQNKPIKREKSIVSLKMLFVIIFNGLYIGLIVFLQYLFNFLNVAESEKSGTVFSLFILFQLFNAFNCKELGATSVFTNLRDNKIMLITFLATFLIHVFIEQVAYKLFSVSPLSFLTFIKIMLLAFSIIVISE